jgi:hypothetical protein
MSSGAWIIDPIGERPYSFAAKVEGADTLIKTLNDMKELA